VKVIEIIVSQYNVKQDRIYGLTLRSMENVSEGCCIMMAKAFCRKGMAVVIRPQYNSDFGEVFEYRSFDGNEFHKITWHKGSGSCSISDEKITK